MKLLSENALLGAFVAGIAVIIVAAIAQWLYRRFVRAPKVYSALEAGLIKHKCTFLPSTFLASETNYTVAEIERLCTIHPKIMRNKKQLESWCIK
ncbi:hypothetical protein RED65_15888 [Bermanella marisrubri]|uniref:Uncharacterized protein n=1 Tax=Bermanella marisrubri TaxID=207949 RepID=Q1N229_9GAMM|nr:hypothetical protein RED65_15888 [Bermanella marisrubri]